ncbi:MAG: phosphoribosyltransferase family protein [Candidatus Micrarchaeota archaeon]|nr:phosphoribosyltransferase family protein [Candidatus Micrarchaeota archaeon]
MANIGKEDDIDRFYLSWEKIEEMCQKIASEINKKNIKIDKIIAISRGGLIPGRILSSLLRNKNLSTIRVTFYTKPGVAKDKPHLAEDLSTDITDKTVLIVDDVVESGKTLSLTYNYLKERGAKKIYTAALFDKHVDGKEKLTSPDFFCEKISNKWIVYPWEKFDEE